MNLNASYTPKQFNLSGLTGIWDKTLEMHFTLYEGSSKRISGRPRRTSRAPSSNPAHPVWRSRGSRPV